MLPNETAMALSALFGPIKEEDEEFLREYLRELYFIEKGCVAYPGHLDAK